MNQQKIDLEKLKPVAHPFRDILKNHGVTRVMVANYLGVSLPYTCNLLDGQYKMPAKHEAKLQILVDQLQMEGQE